MEISMFKFIKNLFCSWKASSTTLDPHEYYTDKKAFAQAKTESGASYVDVQLPVSGETISDVASIVIRRDSGSQKISVADYEKATIVQTDDSIRVYIDVSATVTNSHTITITFR